MEQLTALVSNLLYSAFGFLLPYALVLFFFVIAIQYITKGRIDAGRAIGSVLKVAATGIKLVTSSGRRRR